MYQHGKRVNRPHNYKIFMGTLAIIGTVVLGVWFMIHNDIGNATAPKSNVPIISTVSGSNEDYIVISEAAFTFQLPKDWRLQDKVNQPYRQSWTWSGTKRGGDDRRLTLHMDIMPADAKMVKLMPISSNGDKFLLGTVSDDCVKFSGPEGVQRTSNAPFQAKWQDVSFTCDPIFSNQTIGTSSKENGISVPLAGSQGRHTFFFFYEDHNVRPDSTIFRDALQSFKAK